MEVEDLYKDYKVDNWRNYYTFEPHYPRYLPNVILAGIKIYDVSIQFEHARSSLHMTNLEGLSKLFPKSSDLSVRYIQEKFFFDSLAYYNYCIDLSWQFLYLFYVSDREEMVQDKKQYLKVTKNCNLESLRYLLWLAKQTKMSEFVNEYFNSKLTTELRRSYNYLKHRGTYYIEGMGIKESEYFPMVLSDGSKPVMIARETIDIGKWKEKLIAFDISFVDYFNHLIKIMPKDYTSTSMNFDDLAKYRNRLEKWIDSKS